MNSYSFESLLLKNGAVFLSSGVLDIPPGVLAKTLIEGKFETESVEIEKNTKSDKETSWHLSIEFSDFSGCGFLTDMKLSDSQYLLKNGATFLPAVF